MAEAPVSTTRDDWIKAALTILIEQGAGEVKILTLAERMGCSRSNFYWFFKDRDALLAELLAHWQSKNTAAIVDRATRPATRISQGVLNIFDCWADTNLFDSRLDFAVREWARRSDAVAAEVARADALRLQAIAALFSRFGASPTQAIVRARTLYFMQLGYYALEIEESAEERIALLPDYIEAFCGEAPDPEDTRMFKLRIFGNGQAA
jgi:AcrR family transcriptional regulator